MAIIKTDKMGCASFIYHTITATLNELINALGEPHFTDIDEDSDIQYEWRFKIENEGSVFSIYDWKEYHEIERDETIEWHIGGISGRGLFNDSEIHTNFDKVLVELRELGLQVK